jgi:hypothetical protein
MIEKEMWVITGLTLLVGVLFVAYLLHKAGGILQKQDARDLKSNYEHWDEE